MARTTTEPSRLELRERLLEQQQRPEDEQEDADPRQARPAGVVGSPLPVVDLHRWARPVRDRRCPGRAGSPVRVGRPSTAPPALVSALGVDLVEQRLAGQVAADVLDDQLVEEPQGVTGRVRRDDDVRASHHGLSGGSGSCPKTSSTAPARCPARSASSSAGSSTSAPREMLMSQACVGSAPITAAPTIPREASVSGIVTTRTSASRATSSSAASATIRSGIEPSGSPVPGTRKDGSWRSSGRALTAMIRIPRADSCRATSRPIEP